MTSTLFWQGLRTMQNRRPVMELTSGGLTTRCRVHVHVRDCMGRQCLEACRLVLAVLPFHSSVALLLNSLHFRVFAYKGIPRLPSNAFAPFSAVPLRYH